jgi:hypothetical protein
MKKGRWRNILFNLKAKSRHTLSYSDELKFAVGLDRQNYSRKANRRILAGFFIFR